MAQAALMRSLGVDASARDRFVTPYSLPVPVAPDMPGPRIHAHIIDTLLTGRHIRPAGGGWIWLLALGLATGVWLSHRPLRDDVVVALWLVGAALLLLIGVALFHWTDGVSLEIGPPLLGILVTLFYVTLRGWAVEESLRT
jgi:CHASE2 domain-containing sensor protein